MQELDWYKLCKSPRRYGPRDDSERYNVLSAVSKWILDYLRNEYFVGGGWLGSWRWDMCVGGYGGGGVQPNNHRNESLEHIPKWHILGD